MGEHGTKDTPKVETSHKQFSLHIRQSQILLYETPRVGADTDVVAEIARIQGRTEGKDHRGPRDPNGGGIEVSVVLTLVAFVCSCFVAIICHGRTRLRAAVEDELIVIIQRAAFSFRLSC